jgi:hypothetical protein
MAGQEQRLKQWNYGQSNDVCSEGYKYAQIMFDQQMTGYLRMQPSKNFSVR